MSAGTTGAGSGQDSARRSLSRGSVLPSASSSITPITRREPSGTSTRMPGASWPRPLSGGGR
jgi:hypothetical protein